MLTGRRDAEGRLDVTTDPVGATSTLRGGVAVNPAGQVHIDILADAALRLNFRDGKLDPRITFTRTTTATYFDQHGILRTAAINEPRFETNPATGVPLGLLCEEGRTNSCLQSETFTVTPWSYFQTGEWKKTALALDGTNNATEIQEGTATGGRFARQDFALAGNQNFAASVFFKARPGSNKRYGFIRIGDPVNLFANSISAEIDLDTMAYSIAPNAIGDAVLVAAGCELVDVGNGWRRLTIVGQPSAAATSVRVQVGINRFSAGYTGNYAGQVGSGAILWGAQVEVLAENSSSYIPTTTAAVARGADDAVMTGTNFSDWFNPLEGTLVGVYDCKLSTAFAKCVSIDPGNNNNVITLDKSSVNQARFAVTDTSVGQANIIRGIFTANNQLARSVGAYKLNDFAAVSSLLSTVAVDTVGTIPVVNRMYIGGRQATGAYLNGHIASFTYYPTRLSNEDLVYLATGAGYYFVNGFRVTTDGRLVVTSMADHLSAGYRPIRAGVPDYWTVNGRAGIHDGALTLPGIAGSNATTPDSAAAAIPGDIDIRVKASLNSWIPTGVSQCFVSQYGGAGNRSYFFFVLVNTGQLRCTFTLDGTTAVQASCSATPVFKNGETAWLRFTRESATGVCKFYRSYDDGATWTQIGNTQTLAAGALFNSTAPVELGSYIGGTSAPVSGNIYEAEVRSGIDGPIVISFNGEDYKFFPGLYLEGLPRSKDGSLCCQADTVPAATDPYVGGIRVGPTGGVYTTYTAPPVGDPPVNTVLPDVTGDAVVGATLTCSTGTWTGTAPITYTYKWYQGNTPIIGANTNTYVTQAGDLGSVLICAVTATNALGSNIGVSQGVRMVNARYDYKVNAGVPATGVISAGSAGAPAQIRVNEVDLDGVIHSDSLSRLHVGDSIIINNLDFVLAEVGIDVGGYFIFETTGIPVLVDGEYLVQLGYNP